ncbi:MAG: hypothetical protein JKY16_06740 [Lutibacter sp.]|nr:hypothetical protein [Lutibacter sp.]
MKSQFLGIFFYFLYLLAMIRPLVPIMQYYANYDYIVNVLCENRDRPYMECNGKCYLEKQLKKANHGDHDHKSTIPSINFEDYPISPLGQFNYPISSNKENYKLKVNSFQNLYQDEYLFSILRPPQV